ncbi:universal stress protein [Methanobacterium paludis]|uniref:UspA domain-containing protein n=1 Tax=Methanobacterium paludis (strain DSM 25820 / JCM 18151 / SWAN1) TaxID=868131 RepID=F6D4G3_METPW|nr:universal stress protein [Methanobacterium paludis]AEG18826.1 UspA domain-containing protein [Methanobacterium paludis]
MRKKILLPTDGSKQAERAGEYAVASADLNGVDIIVLNVIDTHYLDALPQQDLQDQLANELKEEGREAVEIFRKTLEDRQCEGKCKNVTFTTLIKEGKPANVILKTIDEEDIDQVIMGKSGKHGLEKLLLGATTERVVRSANIPVNVIS